MNEREYIRILKILYDGANDYNIKVWSKEPSYSNIQRTIRLIKSYGFSEIYYTCKFENKDMIKMIGYNNGVVIFDQEDVIKKCQELNRFDLFKIIMKGI